MLSNLQISTSALGALEKEIRRAVVGTQVQRQATTAWLTAKQKGQSDSRRCRLIFLRRSTDLPIEVTTGFQVSLILGVGERQRAGERERVAVELVRGEES